MVGLLERLLRRDDPFKIGLDWIISDEGDTYLLETNGYDNPKPFARRSAPHRFLTPLLWDKVLQARVLEEFVPETQTDPARFEEFIASHDEGVVYKKREGNNGLFVNMLEPPKEWMPDLVQSFVHPRTERDGREDYPYVVRQYLEVSPSERDIGWHVSDVFRKRGLTPISEDAHPDTFRINIFDGFSERALRTEPSSEDIDRVGRASEELLSMIQSEGRSSRWNPRSAYGSALVARLIGPTGHDIKYGLSGAYDDVRRALAEQRVDAVFVPVPGDRRAPLHDAPALLRDFDAVVIPHGYSYKQDDRRVRVPFAQRGGRIYHGSFEDRLIPFFGAESIRAHPRIIVRDTDGKGVSDERIGAGILEAYASRP